MKLDPVPTNIQIVESNGVPSNAFVMFLSKLINRVKQGQTVDVTVMDSPTTSKVLHFTDGLLTSIT